MKKFLLLLLFSAALLPGETILRDWKAYTNTTHTSEIISYNNKLAIATWGGLLYYDQNDNSFSGPLLVKDGLAENETATLALLDNGILLAGSKGNGISRIKNDEFLMPLNESSGFDLDFVYDLQSRGNDFIAVTTQGISIFTTLEDWPLPSVINYHSNNGLSSNEIKAAEITENDYIICGSDQGIDFALWTDANDLQWENLNSSNSPLPDNKITSIHSCGDKIVIGTHSGIAVLESLTDFSGWVILGSGSVFDPVYAACDGSIWTSAGYWDEESLTVQENSDTTLVRFGQDYEMEIWTKTDLNLNQGMITSIYETEKGIAFTLWGEGIIFYENGVWSSSLQQNCLAANFVESLEIDSRNRLWLAHGKQGTPENRRGNRGVSLLEDGLWQSYNTHNSGLVSDNIHTIKEVSPDIIWFTSYANDYNYQKALNILDITDSAFPEWSTAHYINDLDLPSESVGGIEPAADGNIWLPCYNGGIAALSLNLEKLYEFYAPHLMYEENSVFASNVMTIYQMDNYTVAGAWLMGFEVWAGDTVPDPLQEDNWLHYSIDDFTSGYVSDAVQRNEYFEEQVWIASSHGLYMYDGETWYRYGKESTKLLFLETSYFTPYWEPTTLIPGVNDSPLWWYFEGQEHLYGGASTFPTALLVDPFNVLWIGTENNGICRYDIENNIFMTWNTDNSPLFTNKINDLAYDSRRGILYIATSEGLNSVRIGIANEDNTETSLNQVKAFPNPFYPTQDEVVRIENLNADFMPQKVSSCSIYDLEGLLVKKLELNNLQQFEWNGTNQAGKNCSSGIYFYLLAVPEGESARGKIILIR